MAFRIHRGIFQKLNAERTAYENTFKIDDDGRIKEVDAEGNVTSGYLKVGEQATDADTVDGIQAGSFLRSDADDETTGALRVNKNWGAGFYTTEQFTIRGTYPSMTLRSTTANNKWLFHSDASGKLQFYEGDGTDNNTWDRHFEFDKSGNFTVVSGNITTVGTVFADVFSDRNNTSYYLDPANISYLNDLRPNVIYDRNDTNYYLNLNGDSRANNFRTTGEFFAEQPAWGGFPLAPNLIHNSYMNKVTNGVPDGWSVLGDITIEAVSPWTKAFEGPYTAEAPANAVDNPEDATESNPYWFGRYYNGPRIGRGGMRSGWHSQSDGKILKVTGTGIVSPAHCAIYPPKEENNLGARWLFSCFVKIVKGSSFKVGTDAGYRSVSGTQLASKTQTDAGPQGWIRVSGMLGTSQITRIDALAMSLSIIPDANGDIEGYIALPYLANATYKGTNYDSWSGSVLDKMQRHGFYIHPTNGSVEVSSSTFTIGGNQVATQSWVGSQGYLTSVPSTYATTSYVDTAVSNLVDSAPGALNTLNELAAALGDDANFSTTVTNAIAAKADASHNHDDVYHKLDFDAVTSAGRPDAESGTWTKTVSTTNWGSYKVGTDTDAGRAYNDAPGYVEYNIPSGYSTAYIGQLKWSSGGYFDVHAKKTDGSLVHRGRYLSKQSIENSSHGGDHDGQQIIKVSGLDGMAAIRITNLVGRVHLQGIGWTKELDTDGTQDSTTHWDLINSKPSTFAPSAHNQAWSTITSTPTTLAGYGITDALASSSYTAADVLTKIKTVDGSGSGLDADTVDGYHASRLFRIDGATRSGANFTDLIPSSNETFLKELHQIETGVDYPAGAYTYGLLQSTKMTSMKLQWYVPHTASRGDNNTTDTIYFRTGWGATQIYDWKYLIHSGNIAGQSVNFATTAGTANAVTWSNVSGKPSTFAPSSHTHSYNDLTDKPTIPSNNNQLTNGAGYITGSGNTSGYAGQLSDRGGYGNNSFSFNQESGTFAGYTGWANYFIGNHGDGATYYNTVHIMPFWGVPQYSRLEGGTFKGPWTYWTTENMSQATVNTWNTAYGWGNHASAGYVTSVSDALGYTPYQEGTALSASTIDASSTISAGSKLKVEAGHNDARMVIAYNHNGDSSVENSGNLVMWTSEPGISYNGSGIGGNINESGHYYGKRNANIPYGVALRFNVASGRAEFLMTNSTNNGSFGVGWYVDDRGNTVQQGSITAPGYNNGNWDTAYGWGNHASAGYLTSVPNIDASKITSGTLGTARIPSLAASKITSGTFANARISQSSVTQHQGALSIAASQVTGLTNTPPVQTTAEGGEPSTLVSIHFSPGEGRATFTLADGSSYVLAFAR